MSMSGNNVATGPDLFLQLLAQCIEALGTRAFYEPFIAIVDQIVGADQCMIFSYDGAQARCYFSYNARTNEKGKFLSTQYINGGFKEDPLYRRALALPNHDFEIWSFAALRQKMTTRYTEAFFSSPGLIDKVSIVMSGPTAKLCVSFYRYVGRPLFSESAPAFADAMWTTLCRLIQRHYATGESALLESPLVSLSNRERYICGGILRGLTTAQIASELHIASNTATTYRKRAYEKLGINSKAALFVMCGSRP
jgi:DNA-binding CsgD family transcriptional regulator